MKQHPILDLTPFTLAAAAQRKAVVARRRKLRRQEKKKQSANKHSGAHAALAHSEFLLQGADAAPMTLSVVPNASRTSSRTERQRTGDLHERRAWESLQQAGCTLLAWQLRCPVGELDLVVREGQTLVFVEVRYRNSEHFGGAVASVTRAKQIRLLRAIDWWLPTIVHHAFGGRMPPCRIDLAAFDQNGLSWHRDAVCLVQDK